MVGKRFSKYDFEGRHDYVVLAFDGKAYTIGHIFGGEVLCESMLTPEDLEWFIGD